MKLNGLEVVGIVPNMNEINSNLVHLSSSLISVGGPNGSGKSELLRRVSAAFSGDSSKLDVDVQPGVIVKILKSENSDRTEENLFQEDRFVQQIHSGILENLHWKFFSEQIGENPESEAEFERGIALALGMSLKLNFEHQLNDSLKIFNSFASELEAKQNLTPSDILDIEKFQEVQNYIQTKVYGNENFASSFVIKFMETYEILLVPVGNSDRCEWNVYLLNRELNEDIDELSVLLYMSSRKKDLFHENLEQSINFSLKREIGVFLASRHDSTPWLLINMGRISASGFTIINPDEITIADLNDALNQSATSVFSLDQVGMSFRPEIDPEKNKKATIKRMRDLLSSLDRPKMPRIGDERNIDFFAINEESGIEVSKEVFNWIQKQSDLVNSILEEILPTLPSIQMVINEPRDWIAGGIFKFVASVGDQELGLEKLSPTQQRWVKFVLAFALFTYNDRPIILLDEPELGVQRNLETKIFEVISGLASNSLLLASSHSSTFLRAPQVIGVQVNDLGVRSFRTYFGSLYSHLNEFDISEAEYFESFSLIVVTEGERDKAMLEGFAGEKFENKEILLVSGSGIKSWEGFFTSSILPMLVKPKILFLVDGFDSTRMNASIQEAKKIAHKGHAAVKYHFKNSIRNWSKGPALGASMTMSFAESLTRAVLSESSDRIFFDAMEDRDCIEWLPISSFPLDENSWEDVWKSAESTKSGDVMTGEDFKNYIKKELERKYSRLNIKPETLREMTAMLSIRGATPNRITKLIERIIKLSEE